MAIINCPACGKRISSVAKSCEYCKSTFDDSMEDEKILRDIQNTRFAKIQKLQNSSFISVLLFAAGALVMYLGINNDDETMNLTGRIMLSAGFIGYVVTRVMLFMNKRK